MNTPCLQSRELHNKIRNLFLFAQVFHKNHQHLKCQVLDTWEDMWGGIVFLGFLGFGLRP